MSGNMKHQESALLVLQPRVNFLQSLTTILVVSIVITNFAVSNGECTVCRRSGTNVLVNRHRWVTNCRTIERIRRVSVRSLYARFSAIIKNTY